MYGSYFFVFIRAIVCIIWYGIQTFYAGNLLSVMLRCIFGNSWKNFGNTLPVSANVNSKQLLTFFMAWLLEFPFVSDDHLSKESWPIADYKDVHSSSPQPLHLYCERLHDACSGLRRFWLVYGKWRRTQCNEPCLKDRLNALGLAYHGRRKHHLRITLTHAGEPA